MSNSYFHLGETDFGVGKVSLLISEQADLFTLEITGDQLLTQQLAADPDGPFGWVLYPPKLYFRAVPYPAATTTFGLTVDETLLDSYDIALYLLEHNDIYGTLTVAFAPTAIVEFAGETQLEGKAWKLAVRCEATVESLSRLG